jgi:predicted permease
MEKVVIQTMPIFMLCLVGYFCNRRGFISRETIAGIKKLIISIGLPATLFITMLGLELRKEYVAVVLLMFLMLVLGYIAGVLFNKLPCFRISVLPLFCTGFSFGFLGIPLYGMVFGMENIGNIAMLGIGHEIFVWVIYYSMLKITYKNEKFSWESIIDCLKSPIVISIFAGILCNLLGLQNFFKTNVVFGGLVQSLTYLGQFVTPLILICVGYGINLKKEFIHESIKLTGIRLIITFGVGYLLKWLVLDAFIEPSYLFDAAFFTFLIMPPLFSLPIFIGEYGEKREEELVNTAVVLNTIVSMVVFVVYSIIVIH